MQRGTRFGTHGGEARWFIDHQQVIVFEEDLKWDHESKCSGWPIWAGGGFGRGDRVAMFDVMGCWVWFNQFAFALTA